MRITIFARPPIHCRNADMVEEALVEGIWRVNAFRSESEHRLTRHMEGPYDFVLAIDQRWIHVGAFDDLDMERNATDWIGHAIDSHRDTLDLSEGVIGILAGQQASIDGDFASILDCMRAFREAANAIHGQ